jgi:arabinofuranan 3-O-arabinosyltransferase
VTTAVSAPDAPVLRTVVRGVGRRLDLVLLAALAYLPSLSAGHGRMPADTKLYLYLDPGRLVTDAPFTFDPRQFAGWVPHQTISYLWPSGPWYWLFETLGVPDWIAHRLWIGTILFVAGLGVRWCARRLGLGPSAAVVAAVVYQLTPFFLPYLSRTSLMLLPYASLGWIVGLTILAARSGSWRHPALLALVVATVAAPNATAIAMIVPAPVLWLVHATWGREVPLRRALATTGRIVALCVPVSLWWLAMLSVQGRYGADVLSYSETLEAVSLTSTSVETLRGMGYWLFYVRDPVGFTTSAAEAYMVSGRLIATSAALTALGLAGLTLVRFRDRRFAVLLVIVGIVIAVGVHPIDDPSPLMSPFASSSRSTLVLALRSSTRALPLSVLGLALGAGALAASVTDRLRARSAATPLQWIPPAVVVLIAIVNLPSAWNGGFVDPVLSRDQDAPDAWIDAAADLDAMPAGFRVMQLPGAEFGAFTWGYTVDPPLPGLTERPLVTRDLLPLGSPAAMDLVYALDDRFQEGVAEPEAVAPVARLLGVDRLWVANDVWFDRFRTPRPEITADQLASDAAGLGEPERYGESFVPSAVIPSIDERSVADPRIGTELEPVWVLAVPDPVPVVRAKSEVVLVVGSGDGLVDAAAAGLVDGTELVRYSASGGVDGASPGRVIVTDSNRDQARQWRGSQDTRGFTEDGTDDAGVLRFDSADKRLEIFPTSPDGAGDPAETHTAALQEGPVHARSSAYGEPFAYRPEDRAVMAVDGDLTTAWRVADRFDATGEFIELTFDEEVSDLTVTQPLTATTTVSAPNRWITAIDVTVDDGEAVGVRLDETSRTAAGQTIVLPSMGARVRLTVTATDELRGPDTGPDAVGFAEIRSALGPSTEVVRTPVDWFAEGDASPVTIVLTRLRTDPTDRWRRDPEPALVRLVPLPTGVVPGDVDATLRLTPRATDEVLAGVLGHTGTVSSDRLVGVPRAGGWAATDGDDATSWISAFGRPTGAVLTVPVTPGAVGTLRLRQPDGDHSPITSLRVTGSGAPVDVVVPPPANDGASVLDLRDVTSDGTVQIEVTGVDAHTTRDRRSAELVELPSAISELTGSAITPTPLPESVPIGCRTDLIEIDGDPVGLDLGSVSTADLLDGNPVSATPCAGTTPTWGASRELRVVSSPGTVTGLDVDRIVFGRDPATVGGTIVSTDVTDTGRTSRTVEVAACPVGCWLVLGEGLNDGWEASSERGDLGPSQLVDGGFNGWWLEPSDSARIVTFRWTPQPIVTWALVLSALAVVACVVLSVLGGRRVAPRRVRPPRLVGVPVERRMIRWAPALVTGAVGLLVVGPWWGLVGIAAGAVAGWLRRPRLLGVGAVVLWCGIGATVALRVVRNRPFADAGWPGHFEDLHRPGMFVLALIAGTLVARDGRARRSGAASGGRISDS